MPASSPPTPWQRVLGLVEHPVWWGAVVLVLGALPQGAQWGSLQADPLGEGSNHLWMFWRALQRMGGRGEALANVPVGVDIPLMDPVNLPWFVLGGWIDPGWGWRTMVWGNLLLALAGGFALARELVGRRAATVGMVALGSAPFLGGVMDFGITESWPLGWFALHLALLVRHARWGRARDAVLAGVCLGMVALSGWYHAAYGLLLTVGVVPVLLVWSRRPGLVWQGGVALVMVLPSLVRFLAVRSQWEPRLRAPAPGPPGPRPDWGELPVFGADLLTFVVPHPGAVHPSKATYLGLVVLALAVVGAARRRAGRWFLGLALAFLALAVGYWPTVGGVAIGLPGPAKLIVEAVPALLGMSHWQRAAGPAVVLLAAGAAMGAAPIARRRGAVLLLCCAVVADALLGAPTAWPRTITPLTVPASLEALTQPGGLVQVPFDNGRRPFSEEPPRIYQRWQVLHGRPIGENYEGIDALLATSPLVAHIDAACSVRSTLPPYYQPPPEMRELPAPANVGAEVAALRGQGLRWLVLHRARCRTPAKLIRRVEGLLGPRVDLPGGDAAWDLEQATARGTVESQ